MNVGKVIQVAGPAVDVEFPEGHIPVIRTAVRITSEGFNVPDPIDIICEVAQHIGEGRVRTIALQPTDGLVRGMQAIDTGEPVNVPVGGRFLVSTNGIMNFSSGSSLTVAGELEVQSGGRVRLDGSNPPRDVTLAAGSVLSGAGTIQIGRAHV